MGCRTHEHDGRAAAARGDRGAMARRLLAALLAAALGAVAAGCGDATAPTGAQGGLEEGRIIQLEGSPNWRTNSVSWTNRGGNGVVPENEFAFIAASLQASNTDKTHFFFSAPVKLVCDDAECFPGRGIGWAEIDLVIEALDWSPAGAQIVFAGRRRGENASNVFLKNPFGDEPRQMVGGRMPSFSRDGGRVVYVNAGKTAIRDFNTAAGGGGGDLLTGHSGVENPRLSPGDSLLAFSAGDGGRGQRIFVWDTRHPEFFPDTVTDPDPTPSVPVQDGSGDAYPTWSPGSRYIAYKTTLRRGNQIKDAIFLTLPAQEPERNIELVSFSPGQELSYLRWHPSGKLLLFVLDGDAFMFVMPERYRDAAR